MSPIVRECQRRDVDFYVLHTGQHYSPEMDAVFFETLELPSPKHRLDTGSGSHGAQTGKMLASVESVLERDRPDVLLVQGDTNSVLAGALAAVKLHIPVGHVEAGLRSGDRAMPEEINRIVADHISDFNYAPTTEAAATLRREGIAEPSIQLVGNTIVDAVRDNIAVAKKRGDALASLGIEPGCYALVTVHRAENVDDPRRFSAILEALGRVGKELDVTVVYPIHPRSRKKMEEFGLTGDGIRLVEPQDFLAFLQLESNARLLLTDSGGIQEEGCIMGVPCVTLRDSTERPETITVGANMLAGVDPAFIVDAARTMAARRGGWPNPFGDGRAAARILDHLVAEGLA